MLGFLCLSFAAFILVFAVPVPQQTASNDCNVACTSVYQSALQCQQGTTENSAQEACFCAIPGSLQDAESCLACNGGDVFSSVSAIANIINVCNDLLPGGDAIPSGSGASSRPASTTAGITGALVTISGWAPSGFEQRNAPYYVRSTGGANTTMVGLPPVTVTDSAGEPVTTATVTDIYVIGPTVIQEIVAVEDKVDAIYCAIGASGVADCLEYVGDVQSTGLAFTDTTSFQLTGSTIAYKAQLVTPRPTASAAPTFGAVPTGSLSLSV